MKNVFLLGIKLFWYNFINYPKLWKKIHPNSITTLLITYLDGTENLFNGSKETSMHMEKFKKNPKYIPTMWFP